jgi:epoxide hydrolase-like predicted phosphatase
MIKAIIFDFGGVCFYPGSTNQMIKEALFNSNLPKAKIILLLLDFKKRRMIKNVVEEFNSGRVDEKAFWDNIKKITKYDFDENKIKERIISLNRPIKPVMNVIKKLRKRYKVGLLTNNNSWLDEINRKHNFYQNFDAIVNSFDVKTAKPSEKIYMIMLKRLGVKPEEAVFVDDKKENIDAARRIGIKAIHYKNPEKLLKDLRSFGVDV